MMEGGPTPTPIPIPIPTGERVLAGLRTYFAGFSTTGTAFVLACDVSGYQDLNIREFAHKIAENGYYVMVPDFCRGDPFVSDASGGRPFAAWLEDHDPSLVKLVPCVANGWKQQP